MDQADSARAKLQAIYGADTGIAFFRFIREVLGYDDLTYDTHYPICEFIVEGPGDGSWKSSNIPSVPLSNGKPRRTDIKRKLLLCPRSSFKTTMVTVSYTIWSLVRNPYERIVLAHYNIEKSKEWLEEIKDHFENNVQLRDIFGDHYNKKVKSSNRKWSATDIQLFDPYHNSLVPVRNMFNIRCVGLQTSFTGAHPDKIIADDTVCTENVSGDKMLEQPKIFFKKVEPMMDEGSELLVAGTRYHYLDAYAEMVEKDMFDVFLRSARHPKGGLWFPEKLTDEFLRIKERMLGPYEFSCQYLLEPVSPDQAKFKAEWVEACQEGADNPPPREMTDNCMYVDPAATATKKSDDSAILVVSKDAEGILWVKDAQGRCVAEQDLVDIMVDKYQSHHLDTLYCEAQVFQNLLEPMVRRTAKDKKVPINFIPYKQNTKVSKEFRIRALAPLVSAGMIRIPSHCSDLLLQLTRYPKGKDDLLDVLARAAEDLIEPNWVTEEREAVNIQAGVTEFRKQQDILQPDDGPKRNLFNDIFN